MVDARKLITGVLIVLFCVSLFVSLRAISIKQTKSVQTEKLVAKYDRFQFENTPKEDHKPLSKQAFRLNFPAQATASFQILPSTDTNEVVDFLSKHILTDEMENDELAFFFNATFVSPFSIYGVAIAGCLVEDSRCQALLNDGTTPFLRQLHKLLKVEHLFRLPLPFVNEPPKPISVLMNVYDKSGEYVSVIDRYPNDTEERVRALSDSISRPPLVVDLNANFGIETAYFAKKGFRVIAFEPIYGPILKFNVNLNELNDRVIFVPRFPGTEKQKRNITLGFDSHVIPNKNILVKSADTCYTVFRLCGTQYISMFLMNEDLFSALSGCESLLQQRRIGIIAIRHKHLRFQSDIVQLLLKHSYFLYDSPQLETFIDDAYECRFSECVLFAMSPFNFHNEKATQIYANYLKNIDFVEDEQGKRIPLYTPSNAENAELKGLGQKEKGTFYGFKKKEQKRFEELLTKEANNEHKEFTEMAKEVSAVLTETETDKPKPIQSFLNVNERKEKEESEQNTVRIKELVNEEDEENDVPFSVILKRQRKMEKLAKAAEMKRKEKEITKTF